MEDRRDRDLDGLDATLEARARTWGKLSMLRTSQAHLEAELEECEVRLRQEMRDVERLERLGIRSLLARLRGRLPELLEAERQEVVSALEQREGLRRRLKEARNQRDGLETQLAVLKEREAGFGAEAVARARARREEAARNGTDAPVALRRAEDQARQLRHDLEDLEATREDLEAVAHHLEAAHDALTSIETPGFLAVISGVALLDLFEREEIRAARKALADAKELATSAERRLRALNALDPGTTTLETLSELERHRFLEPLYHEGKLSRVLRSTREAVEDFRERIWEARTRVRTQVDEVLVALKELESETPDEP